MLCTFLIFKGVLPDYMFSNRLLSIMECVPVKAEVIDVGADHAYLAIELIKRGIAKKVIATDKNKGPYDVALCNVKEEKLQKYIEVRLGDGLDVIRENDGNTVVIAGMGGSTIVEILQNGRELLEKSIEFLVLQPMNASGSLRKWLCENKYAIVDEKLVEENSKIYEIICAKNATKECLKNDNEDLLEKELGYEIGQILYRKKHVLLHKKLAQDCKKLQAVINSMKNSKTCIEGDRYQKKMDRLLAMEAIINE